MIWKVRLLICSSVLPGEQFERGGSGADILEEPYPEIYPASFALPSSTSALWRRQHPL